MSRRVEGGRGEDERCVGGRIGRHSGSKKVRMPRKLPAEISGVRFADIRTYVVMVPMSEVKATPPRRRRSAKRLDSSTSSPAANSPSELTPGTRKSIEHIDGWMHGSDELGGGRLPTEEAAEAAEEKKETKEGEAEEAKVEEAAEEAKAAGEGEEEKKVEDDKAKEEAANRLMAKKAVTDVSDESDGEQLQDIVDQLKKAKEASMATLKEEQDRSHHLRRSLANPSCHPPSVLAAPPRGAHR